MDTVSYEINIFLVLPSVDDMYKIILYAMDGDDSINDTGDIEFANISLEKEREQLVSICLTSYLFVGMWNRTEKITIITDNKILTL
jgi:hypothetical protein